MHPRSDPGLVSRSPELRAAAVPNRIGAADGPLLAPLGERQAQPVTVGQVSPHRVAALLATEDRRFHHHPGVDPVRLAWAAFATLSGDIQGGSTPTQQLARNLFPRRVRHRRSPGRNLVLALMRREGALGEREVRRAMARPLEMRLRRLDGDAVHAPPVVRPVRPRGPPSAEMKEIDPSRGGRIIPTMPRLLIQRQAQAECAARRQTELLQTLAERG